MNFLESFRGITLPQYNPITAAGTRPLISSKARMADGRGFDRLGDIQAEQGPGNQVYTATIYDLQSHKVEAEFYALKSQTGRTGWLVRRSEPTGRYQKIYARLEAVNYNHTTGWEGRLLSNVQMVFYLQDPTWNGLRYGNYELAYGAMRYSAEDSIYGEVVNPAPSLRLTSGSTGTITLVNAGGAVVRGVLITAWCDALGTLTGGFYISHSLPSADGSPYYTWKIKGDIGASLSQQRVIHTVGKRVTDNSISPIGQVDDFEFLSNHNSEHLIGLHEGENDIIVGTNTGTFPTQGFNIKFEYAEPHQ